MRLTRQTDFALRTLIYLGSVAKSPIPVSEISRAFDLSHNHIAKVAHLLNRHGITKSTRGKSGGLELAKAPKDIKVGAVIKLMEADWDLLECFNTEGSDCCIEPSCQLKNILFEARNAFFQVLDKYSLQDLLNNSEELKKLFYV